MHLKKLKKKDMSSSPNNLPKLLCDENIPKKIADLLKKEGFDVRCVPFGGTDEQVGELAKAEQRVLLTFDKHFVNRLLFPPEKYPGIIYIRIRPPFNKTVFSSLLNLFNSIPASEFNGKLFVLSPVGYRFSPKRPSPPSK